MTMRRRSGDLARDLKRSVSDSEVRAAFLSLAARGLVNAYIFDQSRNRYVPISTSAAQTEDAVWFMISNEGLVRENEAS